MTVREQTDLHIEAGSYGAAIHGLREIWRTEPGSAAAGFVNTRYRKLAGLAAAGDWPRALVQARVAVLRSYTVEPLLPLVEALCWQEGIQIQFHLGEFNAWAQEARDGDGAVARFQPGIVLLALDPRTALPDLYTPGGAASSLAAVESAVDALQRWSKARILITNACPPERLAEGLLDSRRPDGVREQVAAFNSGLNRLALARQGVYVMDVEALAARHGYAAWGDARKWHSVRQPLAAASLLPMAREWMRFLHPMTGRTAKVCVTDLDNTLWGGVIGEDGIDGIRLSSDPPGAHFQALQQVLLDLYRRGILLAIASKNNPDDALEAITRHPDMLLRREHFAALQIHWHEKSQSLRAIAAELNLGVDSLAFIDDNPVERQQVRDNVPEAWVIDLPADPAQYAATVAAQPFFERLSITDEDRERGSLYAAERERTALRSEAGSVEEFLRSLEQQADLLPVTARQLERAAQLTQKTNQFNLTTRRYSEAEVAARAADGNWIVRVIRVRDRYGDNGIVGLAMVSVDGDAADVDTFLLSCRVISRGVESALLGWLAAEVAGRGCRTLRGWFLPTRKNAPCKDFYAQHGFQVARQDEAGGTLWELDLAAGLPSIPDWIVMNTAMGDD